MIEEGVKEGGDFLFPSQKNPHTVLAPLSLHESQRCIVCSSPSTVPLWSKQEDSRARTKGDSWGGVRGRWGRGCMEKVQEKADISLLSYGRVIARVELCFRSLGKSSAPQEGYSIQMLLPEGGGMWAERRRGGARDSCLLLSCCSTMVVVTWRHCAAASWVNLTWHRGSWPSRTAVSGMHGAAESNTCLLLLSSQEGCGESVQLHDLRKYSLQFWSDLNQTFKMHVSVLLLWLLQPQPDPCLHWHSALSFDLEVD